MIVIIEDRLGLGELMIQPARGFGVQQEIFVDEFHGQNALPQIICDGLFVEYTLTCLPVAVSTRFCSLA